MILYGCAHSLGALFVEGAASHAGAWFTGQLWHDDLSNMSPANSALWLSFESFGIPLILIGATIVWMDRRGITPPAFIGWAMAAWTLVDATILLFTPWPIMLVASTMLVLGWQRKRLTD
jgi:hypothetical protein